MAAQVEREGVVRDAKTGELIIPASQRPDGSWRKARRVRDGYIPQEEVPVFESKGTQWLKSLPTHPIGLAPEDVKKHEQAKKAAQNPTVAVTEQVHTSKAAKKNAKRKEKKKQEQAAGGASDVAQVTRQVEQVHVSSPPTSSAEAKTDLAKKLKSLKKKLKQIEDLEGKIASGELKNPEKDQLEKVARKHVVFDEIEDIELEMEDS